MFNDSLPKGNTEILQCAAPRSALKTDVQMRFWASLLLAKFASRWKAPAQPWDTFQLKARLRKKRNSAASVSKFRVNSSSSSPSSSRRVQVSRSEENSFWRKKFPHLQFAATCWMRKKRAHLSGMWTVLYCQWVVVGITSHLYAYILKYLIHLSVATCKCNWNWSICVFRVHWTAVAGNCYCHWHLICWLLFDCSSYF